MTYEFLMTAKYSCSCGFLLALILAFSRLQSVLPVDHGLVNITHWNFGPTERKRGAWPTLHRMMEERVACPSTCFMFPFLSILILPTTLS